MKVIVLGGSGFLGKHVNACLKQQGHDVVSVSRREGCDIANLAELRDKFRAEEPDAIINCAAHVGSVHYAIARAADMVRDNMQILINIYAAVQETCPQSKVINPISNCSYPGDANTHYEPDWQKGAVHDSVLAYGTPRRMIHAFAECYRKQYGIQSVNWLIANAYGPGDYADPNKVHALNGIIIRLIRAMRAGEDTFEIWGSGKPLREWVYVGDAAGILTQSLEIDEQIYPLNLAQNKAYSIIEIAEIAAKALEYDVRFTFNTSYADGAQFKILDDRNFRAKYPEFQFTPLAQGIQKTIEYYQRVLD